jgi:hypothetical protein
MQMQTHLLEPLNIGGAALSDVDICFQTCTATTQQCNFHCKSSNMLHCKARCGFIY